MWDNFLIKGPDGSPLGEPEDVLARLGHAFPDMAYELQVEESALHVPPGTWEYLIEWLRTRGGMGHPRYDGYFGSTGCFRFLARSPVMEIEAGFILGDCSDQDRDTNMGKLLGETGWVRAPFKHRKALRDFLSCF